MSWARPLRGLAAAVIAGFLLFPLAASAAEEVSVSARVDKSEVRQGETLIFEILLSGLGQETPKIRMSSLEGFKAVSTGQSQQVQIQSGKMNQTMTITYALLALEPGERTLGPVQVEVQGKKLETRPVKVKVLPSAPKEPELKGEVVL